MGLIDRPILPLYLYRYRGLTSRSTLMRRELDAITRPYIYCSVFSNLNDPMEGFYRPSSGVRRSVDYEPIVENLLAQKNLVGIASLSDTKDNELMWTHYASNYSGICVEYYAERLLHALPSRVRLAKLGYGDEPPRVSGRDVANKLAAARKIFSQKKYNWAYEREWRVLGQPGVVPLNASRECVRSVRLGARINPGNRATILKAMKGLEIDVYQQTVDGYVHGWDLIQEASKRKKQRAARRKEQAARK
jgi:Protein of unknown function (DUF2971)